MSNMSRGRKEYGPRAPVMQKKRAAKKRTVMDNIKAAGKAAGGGIPTTKEVPAGGMTKEIGRKASKQAGKKVAAKNRRRAQIGQVAAKAGADMAEQTAASRAQFNAEHDQAVSEGGAMHQRMRQSRPGRAAEIIKKRRI